MTTKGWIVLGLLAAAIVCFVFASTGWWPDDLQDDLEPVALGLAFLAVAFGVHLFMHGGELVA